jgi:PAS domain S-box-containing protein
MSHAPPAYPVEDWLLSLIDKSIDYAIIVIDPQGQVLAWRGAAAHLFGYTEQEALGMPFSRLFTQNDLERGLDRHEIALALASGRSEDDRWHVRQDGGTFWASGILHAVKQADGHVPALCKVVRDRTDIRTQLDSLMNQVALRDTEAIHRQAYLASLVHELRNPLSPVLAASALLAQPVPDDLKASSVQVLQRQVGVLKALLDDLQQAAIESPTAPRLRTEPVCAQEALRVAADSLSESASARDLQLQLTLPPAPIWIAADPDRLHQMLLNLLNNAVKYTPPGGHINLSATVEAAMGVIRVEDDGLGISPSVLPHIFDLFTREGRASEVPGLGVGLAVVHDLARLHGGSIEARSPGAGRGSIFRLRLPLHGP